jgi:hypothetical protein
VVFGESTLVESHAPASAVWDYTSSMSISRRL